MVTRAAGLSITHNRYGVHNSILDRPVMELWAWLHGVTPWGYVLVMDYGTHRTMARWGLCLWLWVMEPWIFGG